MKAEYEKDNKERVPFEHYLEEYRSIDPEKAAERLHIPYDSQRRVFTVRMMEREYEVSWPQFQAVPTDQENTAYSALVETIPAKISMIRYLCQGVDAQSSGKFLTYREVPWGELYFQPFNGRCLMRLAYGFGNRQELFAQQMEKIGAVRLDMGDIAYEFEYVNGYRVRFILWAGDEEFPPSAQILFSDNFPVCFKAEDLAVVGDVAIGTLKKI